MIAIDGEEKIRRAVEPLKNLWAMAFENAIEGDRAVGK